MNVTQVALQPTEASRNAPRPALTPELLAATGARYSRSNEGLAAILSRIDPAHLDKSVDGIFRMIDYGHQSIADMAPVALFLDGISLWLAYYLWTLCPTAGGQESSTRYIQMGTDGLIAPNVLGIPESQRQAWVADMDSAFAAYQNALHFWENTAVQNPDVLRIPAALQNDASPRAQKAVARMTRNYAFDRARYFLPVAAQTNVMIVQSARGWVSALQNLLSHPLPEARLLGEQARNELALATPRLLRHAQPQPSFEKGLRREFSISQQLAQVEKDEPLGNSDAGTADAPPSPFLHVYGAEHHQAGTMLAADLEFHDNRYAYFGETLRTTPVRFGWAAVAFAEIRDLNRHRTGTKQCDLLPVGFYHAGDQLPIPSPTYQALGETGRALSETAHLKLQNGDPTYIYHTLLGTQFGFEHVTTGDKFLYEAELRTGTGAHFRYARHLHDVLALWYARFPETRGLVIEGSAEPE